MGAHEKMSRKAPRSAVPSLLERAAEHYGFDAMVRGEHIPGLDKIVVPELPQWDALVGQTPAAPGPAPEEAPPVVAPFVPEPPVSVSPSALATPPEEPATPSDEPATPPEEPASPTEPAALEADQQDKAALSPSAPAARDEPVAPHVAPAAPSVEMLVNVQPAPETEEEAAQAVSGISRPVRGWTGPVRAIDRKRLIANGYIQPDGQVTGTGEEFRIVKRQLLAGAFGDRGGKKLERGNIIMMCSSHPADGKTWCSINLAVSLAAEQDMDVLLIDADVGKPAICGQLGLPQGPGLMDAIRDPGLPVEDMVIRTDLPSLSVLSSGKTNRLDTEMLASERCRTLLERLANGHPRRVLIIDTPPVLAASPASVLARHVGQLVIVVRADRTSEPALRDAANLLSGCAHLRLLLNGVKFSSSGRQFGSYYGKTQ